MDIKLLGKLVDRAVEGEPPTKVRDACGGYYNPYYYLVYLLAQHMAPCVVVELGVAYGRFLRCAAVAGAGIGNVIVGIDTVRYPELDVVLSAHNNVVFINEPSVPRPVRVPSMIDILHIDTNHTYAQAKAEFEVYQGLLSDGAVVMFDDLRAAEDDVLRYFNELPYPKIRDDRLHPALGYGVMVYNKKENGYA